MATSGSKSITVTSYDTLKFSWSRTSYSIANNTSTIKWTLELISSTYGQIISTASKAWTVTVNGTKYSGTAVVGINNNATKTLASGTTTITHNTDGTKTFSYSFSQSFTGINFGGTELGVSSGSGTGTLDTIPRASSLSASNGTLGTAQTLTVTRPSTSFTHTITYKCGTASGTVVTKSSSTSISFTPPLDLAKQNTSGNSVLVVFTITTYNGSTTVGSNTKTITCTIPSDKVKPSCIISVSDSTEYLATYNDFVKGLSKLKIDIIDVLSYNSPIASYSVKVNGQTYNKATFTTDVISSGTLTVTATITDNRGNSSGAITETFTVLDYAKPSISKMTVSRCNQDGTDNKQGAYAKVVFSSKVSPLNNKNSAVYKVSVKTASETTYKPSTVTALNGKYEVTNHAYIFEADINTSYNVKVSVTDDINTGTAIADVSTGFTTVHYKKNGRGVGIGKVVEEDDLLDVEFNTWLRGSVFGNVVGLSELITVPDNSNINEYLSPGAYAIRSNVSAKTMSNLPSGYAGRLIVYEAVGKAVPTSGYSYIVQVYIPFKLTMPVYARNVTRETTTWAYENWRVVSFNPEMVQGTEYITSERYETSPVYTKCINLGALPNNGSKSVSIGVSSSKIHFVHVLINNGSFLTALPFIGASGTPMARYFIGTNSNLALQTWGDYSDYNATVIIKYTK